MWANSFGAVPGPEGFQTDVDVISLGDLGATINGDAAGTADLPVKCSNYE